MSPSNPNPLVAFAMLLVLAGCEANTAPAVKSERPVQVQRVSFESENAARDFVGVVRARYETDLGFRVAGKMIARLVNVGDRVRAADVVARRHRPPRRFGRAAARRCHAGPLHRPAHGAHRIAAGRPQCDGCDPGDFRQGFGLDDGAAPAVLARLVGRGGQAAGEVDSRLQSGDRARRAAVAQR